MAGQVFVPVHNSASGCRRCALELCELRHRVRLRRHNRGWPAADLLPFSSTANAQFRSLRLYGELIPVGKAAPGRALRCLRARLESGHREGAQASGGLQIRHSTPGAVADPSLYSKALSEFVKIGAEAFCPYMTIEAGIGA